MIALTVCVATLVAVVGVAHAEAVTDAEAKGSTITCSVAGYDIVILNEGEATIPPGTVVAWEVPFARMSGTFVLTLPLDPARQIVLTAVLGSSYLASPKPCMSELQPASGWYWQLHSARAAFAELLNGSRVETQFATRG